MLALGGCRDVFGGQGLDGRPLLSFWPFLQSMPPAQCLVPELRPPQHSVYPVAYWFAVVGPRIRYCTQVYVFMVRIITLQSNMRHRLCAPVHRYLSLDATRACPHNPWGSCGAASTWSDVCQGCALRRLGPDPRLLLQHWAQCPPPFIGSSRSSSSSSSSSSSAGVPARVPAVTPCVRSMGAGRRHQPRERHSICREQPRAIPGHLPYRGGLPGSLQRAAQLHAVHVEQHLDQPALDAALLRPARRRVASGQQQGLLLWAAGASATPWPAAAGASRHREPWCAEWRTHQPAPVRYGTAVFAPFSRLGTIVYQDRLGTRLSIV